MRCAAALSTHPIPAQATGDVIADLLEYGPLPPDLLVVVTTPEFAGAAEDIISTVSSLLRPAELLFVVSAGVLAAGSEVTAGAGLGVWACWCDSPQSDVIRVIPLGTGLTGLGDEATDALRRSVAVVLLGDPGAEEVTTAVDSVLALLPHQEVSGGLLSAARGPVRLVDSTGRAHPAVAVAFGMPSAEAILGHGSFAISPVMTATNVVGTRLCEIDARPAIGVANEIISMQDPETRTQTARDLAIAVHGINDINGDHIVDVHRVLGVDREINALALTGEIPMGAAISFHRQDRDGGDIGLEQALSGSRARGALLFTCTSLDPTAEQEGVGDLGLFVEALGTAAFAGVRVSTVIGRTTNQVGLRPAPLSATIFGRAHH